MDLLEARARAPGAQGAQACLNVVGVNAEAGRYLGALLRVR